MISKWTQSNPEFNINTIVRKRSSHAFLDRDSRDHLWNLQKLSNLSLYCRDHFVDARHVGKCRWMVNASGGECWSRRVDRTEFLLSAAVAALACLARVSFWLASVNIRSRKRPENRSSRAFFSAAKQLSSLRRYLILGSVIFKTNSRRFF